jgi:tRNA-dihydrouridine synthase 1
MIDISKVVAPMVAQSDAPFRALCLKYGATAVYSEMLYSHRIVHDSDYLPAFLSEHDCCFEEIGYSTRPLVVQVCGNDPDTLSAAVGILASSGRCDAIDFNLGCPQDRAKDGLFGSYLLDKCYWPLVYSCVEAMMESLRVYNMPLHCKIRLIEGPDIAELTKTFCR